MNYLRKATNILPLTVLVALSLGALAGRNEVNPVVFHLLPDGRLDPNFGDGGVFRFGGASVGIVPVLTALQPDGKIVISATAPTSFVARLKAL